MIPSQLAIASVVAQFNVSSGSKAAAASNNASQSAISPTSVVEPDTAVVPEHTDCAVTAPPAPATITTVITKDKTENPATRRLHPLRVPPLSSRTFPETALGSKTPAMTQEPPHGKPLHSTQPEQLTLDNDYHSNIQNHPNGHKQ